MAAEAAKEEALAAAVSAQRSALGKINRPSPNSMIAKSFNTNPVPPPAADRRVFRNKRNRGGNGRRHGTSSLNRSHVSVCGVCGYHSLGLSHTYIRPKKASLTQSSRAHDATAAIIICRVSPIARPYANNPPHDVINNGAGEEVWRALYPTENHWIIRYDNT